MTETTTAVEERRINAAIVVEVQDARAFAAARRRRPIAADATDTVETAIVVGAITRRRIPDGRSSAKLAGEVYASVFVVVYNKI